MAKITKEKKTPAEKVSKGEYVVKSALAQTTFQNLAEIGYKYTIMRKRRNFAEGGIVDATDPIDHDQLKKSAQATVYVIQEIAGTRSGNPKINIIGAAKYGKFVFCLPEMAQMIFSPGPLIFKLRKVLKDYTARDYLLLTGDPAIIGVACSVVSDITNGKYRLLKWDKQERRYYPIEINLY